RRNAIIPATGQGRKRSPRCGPLVWESEPGNCASTCPKAFLTMDLAHPPRRLGSSGSGCPRWTEAGGQISARVAKKTVDLTNKKQTKTAKLLPADNLGEQRVTVWQRYRVDHGCALQEGQSVRRPVLRGQPAGRFPVFGAGRHMDEPEHAV